MLRCLSYGKKLGLLHIASTCRLLVDFGAMLRLKVITKTGEGRDFNTKPLSVLRGLFPDVITEENTVIVDDHRRSFVLDADLGIHVTPFHASKETLSNDREFRDLAQYMLMIKVGSPQPTTKCLPNCKVERMI